MREERENVVISELQKRRNLLEVEEWLKMVEVKWKKMMMILM